MSGNDNSEGVTEDALLKAILLSSGKLKAVNRTSALMAGFAMVAMVELSIPEAHSADRPPEPLLIAYVTCTTLLVIVHLLALMTSTYLLPNIEAAVHFKLALRSRKLLLIMLTKYASIAWHSSTIVGIMLFLVEIGLLCWVKFYSVSLNAAIASSCVIVAACIAFVVVCVWDRKLLDNYFGEHFAIADESVKYGSGNNEEISPLNLYRFKEEAAGMLINEEPVLVK